MKKVQECNMEWFEQSLDKAGLKVMPALLNRRDLVTHDEEYEAGVL